VSIDVVERVVCALDYGNFTAITAKSLKTYEENYPMPVKHVFAKVRSLPGSFLALLVLSLLALIASSSATVLASSSSVSPGSSQVSTAVHKSPWNAFIYGYSYFGQGPDSAQGIVINQDASGNQTEALTQYVVQKPLYYSVSPDGKNAVFSQVVNGMRQYRTVSGPNPASGFFYEGIDNPARGNVLWTSDSRHVLVLDVDKGVSLVDTQTGKAQRLLSLPYRAGSITVSVIDHLVYYRDNYIYVWGGRTGPCALALCRVSLTGKPQITPFPQISSLDNFLMSPDGKTIYYHNEYQSGPQGIYAMNADGTHNRLVRAVMSTFGTYPLQLGFGAHNELIYIHKIGTKFQLVQLGATPRQDRVLLANAAPGATSLCGSSYYDAGVIGLCPESIQLSPDAQSIVVDGALPGGHDQFWVTNLQTGQQRVIAVINAKLNQPHSVHLLGWDVLRVCGGDNCY
jgi:hypothetical protein